MCDINCGRNASSSQTGEAGDVTSHRTLVEVELTRKIYYEQLHQSVRRWLLDCGDRIHLSEMQIAHILLRYIFNKKATTCDRRSDPVFVTGTSRLARDQLRRDVKTTNLGSSNELADLIDDELARAVRSLRFEKVIIDEQVTLSSPTDGKLIYQGHSQEDFAGLAQRYGPKYYNAAYALGLRYSYMRLTGHGLARAYKEDTKRSADDPLACEGFASAFNHYFDRYYSAFPDLETFFGSRGCFFRIKWEEQPSDMTYYLCPPFDESLMQLCVDHVFNALQKRLVSKPIFVFSIPGSWTNFSALEQLKASSWVRDLIDYPKGKLPFIDYMATREKDRIIYPTDICVITLTSEAKEGKPSAIDLRHDDHSDNAKDTATIQKKGRKEIDEADNCNLEDISGTKKIKLD